MATRLIGFVRSPAGFYTIMAAVGGLLVALHAWNQNWALALATATVIGSAMVLKYISS